MTDPEDLYRATKDREIDAIRRLIADGADLGFAPLKNKWTPLHLAAQHADLEAARALIDAGAPLNARDASGRTPCFVAALTPMGGHDVLSALLDAGADPTIENNSGESAVSVSRIIDGFPPDLLARLSTHI